MHKEWDRLREIYIAALAEYSASENAIAAYYRSLGRSRKPTPEDFNRNRSARQAVIEARRTLDAFFEQWKLDQVGPENLPESADK